MKQVGIHTHPITGELMELWQLPSGDLAHIPIGTPPRLRLQAALSAIGKDPTPELVHEIAIEAILEPSDDPTYEALRQAVVALAKRMGAI